MSQFTATVVALDPAFIEPHPNADNLNILRLQEPFKTIVVFNRNDWAGETKAVYLQPDSVLPAGEEWDFLGPTRTVTTRKLRGVVSDGMLARARPEWLVGDDVKDIMGITKYEHIPNPGNKWGPVQRPSGVPTYTDIESLRNSKYQSSFVIGEDVVLTEKLEGENFRIVYQNGAHVIGSRTNWYNNDGTNPFSQAALRNNRLLEAAQNNPTLAFYGEKYGTVKHFKYEDETKVPKVRIFDIWDTEKQSYLDWADLVAVCVINKLEMAPIIYQGPYLGPEEMYGYGDGPSILSPSHIKEGFVMRPIKERYDDNLGRVILKFASDAYKLKKGKGHGPATS